MLSSFSQFSSFFLKKRKKEERWQKKENFDQSKWCKAPIRSSKYSTLHPSWVYLSYNKYFYKLIFSHAHTLTISFSFTQTHTHNTHTHSLSLSLSLLHIILPPQQSYYFFVEWPENVSLSLSLSLLCTYSHTQTHYFSHSLIPHSSIRMKVYGPKFHPLFRLAIFNFLNYKLYLILTDPKSWTIWNRNVFITISTLVNTI